MLALTMQLIKQGLELIVGNISGTCHHRAGGSSWCASHPMQFIEQAFELIGGDLVDGSPTTDDGR